MGESDSYLERASAALDMGRVDEAKSFASQAIAQDPSNPRGHVTLAWALLDNEPEESLASAERALSADPNYAAAFDVGSQAASSIRKKEQAIDFATRYRELRPNSDRANRRYGEILHECGKHKQRHEALAAVQEAVQLQPIDSANWSALGRIQSYAFNDKDAARASFEKALELNPNSGYAKRQLAHVVEGGGDKGTALSLVQSVIRLDPSDTWARKQLDDIVIRFMSDLLWATMIVSFFAWFVLILVMGPSS